MKAYIWDLDGTVLDSYPAIVGAVYDIFKERGIELDQKLIHQDVIQYSTYHFLDLMIEKYGFQKEEIYARYQELTPQKAYLVGCIPHIQETLLKLKEQGALNFVYTHRGLTSEPILEHLGLLSYFTEVITSANGFPRKPAPDAIEYLLKKYQLDPEETFYVGDRVIDTNCAKNAKINGILYLPSDSYCVPDGTETFIVHDLLDIPDKKFPEGILNVAYSELLDGNGGPAAWPQATSLAPRNSYEHMKIANQYAFNGLKSDLRITKDGQFVMCHDHGYTLDENGQITDFDRNHFIPIIDMTMDEVQQLTFAGYEDMHVCTFDDYMRFCRENNQVAYITARDDRIPEVAIGIMKALKKYGMERYSIVNSFTFETLQEVRKYTQIVPVSQVQNYGVVLESSIIEALATLGNSIVTMFTYPHYESQEDRIFEASKPALDLAKKYGIPLHMAQIHQESTRQKLIQMGFTGFQILYPFEG